MSVHQVDASELFNLLESNDLQVVEEIKNLIHDNLNSSKEAWLLNGLVDYHNACDSDRARDILCAVREPHDKHLFEKLHDGVKTPHARLPSLKILGHVVAKQPSWLHRIVKDPLFGLLIKTLKHENDVPTINCALLILCTILPMIPQGVVPYLDSIFDVFSRLAAFNTKKPGNVPQVFLLHLNVALYSFFHRLYGMYPCRFVEYLRIFYGKRENKEVFDETIKPLLERIRLHPLLILSSKEREAAAERWRRLEPQDIIIECARMSLDPLEGLKEDWTGHRHSSHHHSMEQRDSALSHIQDDMTQSQGWASDHSLMMSTSLLNMFWSPSVVCGLATPPPLHESSSGFHSSLAHNVAASHTPQTPQAGMTSTPAPSPWETTPRDSPPVHDLDQFERSTQGGLASNRSSTRSLQSLSSRSVEKPTPITTVKTTSPYIPEHCDALYSPLKREFTNERPSSLLQLSGSRDPNLASNSSTLVKPTAIRKINLAEFDEAENEMSTNSSSTTSKNNRFEIDSASDALAESIDHRSTEAVTTSDLSSGTPSTLTDAHMVLSSSEKNLLEKLQRSGYELRLSGNDPAANSSGATAPLLHVQSLPQIIEQFSESSSVDNNDDREICDINQVSERSRHASEASSLSSVMDVSSVVMTAESVAQFMKNVNRIRFNSMTVKESQDIRPSQLASCNRAQSCPNFETEDDDSATVSQGSNHEKDLVKENENVDTTSTASAVVALSVVTTISSFVNTSLTAVTGTTDSIPAQSQLLPRMTRSMDYSNQQAACCSRPQSCVGCPPTSMADEGVAKYPYTHLFQHAMPYLPIAECQKCQDHMYISPTESRSVVTAASQQSNASVNSSSAACLGTQTPLYTTFSPAEILDRHIARGGDIHAKELSKLPLTSQDAINWTHFGGVPPSDEINILKGQIHLLHNQLMYERHKREMHSRRNRRLLGKVVQMTSLEERNAALLDQLKLQEEEIHNMRISLKLEQEKLRQLQEQKCVVEKQKDSQISTLAKDNKDLKYNNNELKKLLVNHKEENDRLSKLLTSYKDKVFRLQQELCTANKQVALTEPLRGQVNDLTKKVIVQGEIHKKYQEKLHRLTISHNPKPEAESMIAQLRNQLSSLTQQCNQRQSEVESLTNQLSEHHDMLKSRDLLIAQQKRELETVKVKYGGLLEAVESRYQAMKSINTSLETYILQLHEKIEQQSSKPAPGTRIDPERQESKDRKSSPRYGSMSPPANHGESDSHRQSPSRSELPRPGENTCGKLDRLSVSPSVGSACGSSTDYQPAKFGSPNGHGYSKNEEQAEGHIEDQLIRDEMTDSITLIDSGYAQ